LKKIILFFTLSFFIFSQEFLFNNKKINLDILNIENYTYINIENLSLLNLNYSIQENKVKIKNSEFNLNFFLDTRELILNNKKLQLSNISFYKNNKIYVDFDFILYLIHLKRKDKEIIEIQKKEIKEINTTFPIKKDMKKIISLSPGITEKLYELGAFSLIVGRSIYDKYPQEVKNITEIGTMFSPKIESIIQLNPDIIIAETHFDKKVLSKFNEAGINTLGISYASSIEDIYENILEISLITNLYYEGRGIVASLKNKVERAKYINNKIETKPTVYYSLGSGKVEYTAGRNTYISELINIAGGTNIADEVEGWVYNLESIVVENPDFIFSNKHNIEFMEKSPIYSNLKAFKNNKYFVIDEDILNLSSPRLINNGLYQLIKEFHGEEKLREMDFNGTF